MFIMLLIIGGLGFSTEKNAKIAIAVLLFFSTLVNMTTIGPACYLIVAETLPGRLRYKTIVVGRFAYNLMGIFSNSVTPRMVSSPRQASPFDFEMKRLLTVQKARIEAQRSLSSTRVPI